MDGLALDISSVRWIPIAGNQGIGGITERTIEALWRLPAELQPPDHLAPRPRRPELLRRATTHIHVGSMTTDARAVDALAARLPRATRALSASSVRSKRVGRPRPPRHARRPRSRRTDGRRGASPQGSRGAHRWVRDRVPRSERPARAIHLACRARHADDAVALYVNRGGRFLRDWVPILLGISLPTARRSRPFPHSA